VNSAQELAATVPWRDKNGGAVFVIALDDEPYPSPAIRVRPQRERRFTMTRLVQIVPLQALLVAVGSWAAAGEKGNEQEQAVAAIKQMKGYVVYDRQRPGKPVTEVHLFEGKTAGIGLAPLAKLPEIEWIGLHLSDISEADLEHLKGLTKLRRLGLADVKLTDAGLKRIEDLTTLEILFLMENPITDAGLDHLQKMTKLKELGLGQTGITDAGLERLKTFKDLQTLRLQQLKITEAGLGHLKALTKLKTLDLSVCNQVKDVKPLRGLPLTSLNLSNCNKVQDVTPLEGMPLASLDLGGTQVADLSPLRRMKLTTLNCSRTQVSDLTPLADMPLTSLNLFGCPRLHDLGPLKGMNLTEVRLSPTSFTRDNLQTLRACKRLKTVIVGEKASDILAAQDFWKKVDEGEFKP
jgi:Leucine-rich repeat (LRR) protein